MFEWVYGLVQESLLELEFLLALVCDLVLAFEWELLFCIALFSNW